MGKKRRRAWAIFRETDPDERDKPPLIIKGVYIDPDVVEQETDRLNRLRRARGQAETYVWQQCVLYE
jgi:hypothetical protein